MPNAIKSIIFVFLFISLLLFLFFPKITLIKSESPVFLRAEVSAHKFIFLSFPFKTTKQFPLANPPKEIKGIYFTSFSAGNLSRINYLFNLVKENKINSVVIDIKDYSGYVAYNSSVFEVNQYKTKQVRIRNLAGLISMLHRQGVYVIARITCFQDPVLAKVRPDLAIKYKDGKVFKDNKGLSWVDPFSREVWNYLTAIAKEAAGLGFDEINFDYIRFPSDGEISNLIYPFYDQKVPKHKIIKEFYSYLKKNLKDVKISVDLFGQTMVNYDDLGIGQILEDAFPYFDYICPMLYPSHFRTGFLNFKNPAEYPYEIVKYSMGRGLQRLKNYELKIGNNHNSKIRPWVQDFDLGADYDLSMVEKQIKAVSDACSKKNSCNGYLLWNPSNIYSLHSD